MVQKINLNADIGEGHGAYDIGDDAALLKIIKSANVACGFHAGDPKTMHRLVTESRQLGVSVGAHPGFNDLWGFGRRRIHMEPKDLEYMVAYQIGALKAMACYAGVPVTHVKPHGALNNMAAEDEDLAMAIGRAIKTVDPDLIYVALAGSEMQRAAERLGLPLAREGFADRLYDDNANLASRMLPNTVIKDPAQASAQVVRMVTEGEVVSMSGKTVKVEVDTICVHGDEPTAVHVAGKVREGLEAAGVEIVPLIDMDLPY
ncbi:LamB/YcsF family protein [Dichotomicrobium thermohalophilum]|uniref:5-oxoprolinase subunit A n=1 Tax=Dichotomicrobium thermohalophilum TaxID=933063 RepID=A0A397PPH8_9HYPH|nr:5-oxoprolinase subunit PxpA [Dichotomicrobium thermohalophilum]RIA47651.1 UPF0271 protein [Dichotomicrobium thermohalophilum]